MRDILSASCIVATIPEHPQLNRKHLGVGVLKQKVGQAGYPLGPPANRGLDQALAGESAQCRLLCSAKPVHSGYSCEPPCWLLLEEITPAGPYGSWVTWPVLRLEIGRAHV